MARALPVWRACAALSGVPHDSDHAAHAHLVAVEPIDFRAGIDGLASLCRERLEADPFSGSLFVFRNRARTALKILVYDGQGFWLCHKRLSSGRFAFWPDGTAPTQGLQACELQVLLMAGNPAQTRAAPAWRRLAA
jgi:transposase